MAFLSRDAILQADDRPTEEVAVPEWGGTVLVRGMSGKERDDFEAGWLDKKGQFKMYGNFRASLAAACLVDKDGNQLFAPKDVAELGQKSAAALDRVAETARHLSGVSESDVEELEGN